MTDPGKHRSPSRLAPWRRLLAALASEPPVPPESTAGPQEPVQGDGDAAVNPD